MSHPDNSSIGSIVGSNLRRLMARMGLSPEDLAGKVPEPVTGRDGKPESRPCTRKSLTAKQIRRIANGEIQNPQPSTIQALASALGVTVEALKSPMSQNPGHGTGAHNPEGGLPEQTDEEIEKILFGDQGGPNVEKVPLSLISRVRDLEACFGPDEPWIRKVYANDLSEEDEDWAAELMDLIVTSAGEFCSRWSRDAKFGEVAKREVLKKVLAFIQSNPDLSVSMGTGTCFVHDMENGTLRHGILFIGVAPAAHPVLSCLFNPWESEA